MRDYSLQCARHLDAKFACEQPASNVRPLLGALDAVEAVLSLLPCGLSSRSNSADFILEILHALDRAISVQCQRHLNGSCHEVVFRVVLEGISRFETWLL